MENDDIIKSNLQTYLSEYKIISDNKISHIIACGYQMSNLIDNNPVKGAEINIVGMTNLFQSVVYAIGPDIFVQSTVNRASSILSKNISKEQKISELKEEISFIEKKIISCQKNIEKNKISVSKASADQNKYKEIFETAILVSVFVISVLAIGPIA